MVIVNICFVMNDFKRGGAERLVKDLATKLLRYEHLNPVIIVANNHGELKSEFVTSDIEIIPLGIDVEPSAIPKGVRELITELQSRDVDLVHSHLAFSDLISRIACTRLSLPHISTYHNVQEERSLPKRAIERITRRFSDRIICVSDGVRQSYGNTNVMTVIYNAIDVAGFNRRVSEADTSELPDTVQTEGTVYLNVARCVEVKRQHDLIESMDKINTSENHLIIVGNGPKRQMLEKVVAEKELSDCVTITGYVDRVEPYYACADVFISSSAREGLPTTHIEAMAAQLPIISTDIPGVREIVEHGTHGYLCPVGNPSAIAAAMERLQSADHKRFGDRGYETALSRFSIDKMVEEHIDLYLDLVEGE